MLQKQYSVELLEDTVCNGVFGGIFPEGYFGDLGAWAERRMKELGVDSAMLRIWAR